MNNKFIAAYHNIRFGERCIIVCNGPSLRDVPLDVLKNNITFGTNRIFLLKGFVPTYYVSVNPLVIEQSKSDILKLHCPKFVREGYFDDSTDLMSLHSMNTPLFSYDPSRYIYEGYTVTFVCMQLAFFMGFTDVGLVGIDHKFVFEGDPNEECTMEGDDPNHFDPNYFKGMQWNNPDLEKSELAYTMARIAFEGVDRKITNLTPQSELEVFPKEVVRKWIRQKKS